MSDEEPVMFRIRRASCDWEMTDRDGYAYPHGISATRRVLGAREPFNGRFCLRHARMAIERSNAEALEEMDA